MSAAYLTAKRRIGYKKEGGYRHCSTCAMACRPWGPDRIQCQMIGVADDPDADVLPGASCKAWKGRVR